MAINPLIGGPRSYYNTLNENGQKTRTFNSSDDIYIDRGGIAYIKESKGDDKIVPQSIAMREILPEHPQLSMRDIRLDFRDFDEKNYVAIYNRHNNELLKELPREDFERLFGKFATRRDHTFELYV